MFVSLLSSPLASHSACWVIYPSALFPPSISHPPPSSRLAGMWLHATGKCTKLAGSMLICSSGAGIVFILTQQTSHSLQFGLNSPHLIFFTIHKVAKLMSHAARLKQLASEYLSSREMMCLEALHWWDGRILWNHLHQICFLHNAICGKIYHAPMQWFYWELKRGFGADISPVPKLCGVFALLYMCKSTLRNLPYVLGSFFLFFCHATKEALHSRVQVAESPN